MTLSATVCRREPHRQVGAFLETLEVLVLQSDEGLPNALLEARP